MPLVGSWVAYQTNQEESQVILMYSLPMYVVFSLLDLFLCHAESLFGKASLKIQFKVDIKQYYYLTWFPRDKTSFLLEKIHRYCVNLFVFVIDKLYFMFYMQCRLIEYDYCIVYLLLGYLLISHNQCDNCNLFIGYGYEDTTCNRNSYWWWCFDYSWFLVIWRLRYYYYYFSIILCLIYH